MACQEREENYSMCDSTKKSLHCLCYLSYNQVRHVFRSFKFCLGSSNLRGAFLVITHLPMQETRFNPWVGKIPGEGNGNSFQYLCLENSTDRGAWWVTVHGVERLGHDLATEQQQLSQRRIKCVSGIFPQIINRIRLTSQTIIYDSSSDCILAQSVFCTSGNWGTGSYNPNLGRQIQSAIYLVIKLL